MIYLYNIFNLQLQYNNLRGMLVRLKLWSLLWWSMNGMPLSYNMHIIFLKEHIQNAVVGTMQNSIHKESMKLINSVSCTTPRQPEYDNLAI